MKFGNLIEWVKAYEAHKTNADYPSLQLETGLQLIRATASLSRNDLMFGEEIEKSMDALSAIERVLHSSNDDRVCRALREAYDRSVVIAANLVASVCDRDEKSEAT